MTIATTFTDAIKTVHAMVAAQLTASPPPLGHLRITIYKHPLHQYIEDGVLANLPSDHNVSAIDIERAIDTFFVVGTSAFSKEFARVVDSRRYIPSTYNRMHNLDTAPPLSPIDIQGVTEAAIRISQSRQEEALRNEDWMTIEQLDSARAASSVSKPDTSTPRLGT